MSTSRAFSVLLLLALAGCAGVPRGRDAASACAASEASYECQVQRYHDVAGD